jgi:hypothetical protein
MKKDWKGDGNSVFKTLGSSQHSDHERELNDFYATEPRAIELLLDMEAFGGDVWEPACGEGHLSKVLESRGYSVKSTDLIDRGYGAAGQDFLAIDNIFFDGNIITNPPYRYATEFVEKALSIIPDGKKVAFFLKVQFMEGKGRKHIFINTPPEGYMYHHHGLTVPKMATLQG